MYRMLFRATAALTCLLFLPHGCSNSNPTPTTHLKYTAEGNSPTILALYEAWFGFSKHISVGYSTQDPVVVRRQIREAKARGISGFVVDWYGDREPFIDKSYALMQKIASEENFHVAMMYDETEGQVGATDEAIADFTRFRDTYLSPKSPGRDAYLMYHGRPVIFIFPKGQHTNWSQVRTAVDKWERPPLLIYENLPDKYVDAFNGYYAWINPGPKGWVPDGSDWGEEYLSHFYQTMVSKYPDKIIVGGAWAKFDDSKASWSLNRHIAARCGQTFWDTFAMWKKYMPPGETIPFLLIETWNDYEEGSAVEPGIPTCGKESQPHPLSDSSSNPAGTPRK